MNILILTTHLNPGGISRYVVSLSCALSKNNNVWVASDKGEWQKELVNSKVGYKHIPIATKSIMDIKVFCSFFILVPFVLKNKIDIIHCNTRVTQFIGFLLYIFLRKKYVSSFHGFYRPHLARKIFKFEGIKSIAVSGAVKEHLYNDLKIKKDKIEVIYNGIEKKDFSSKKYRKEDVGLEDSCITLGILGRISEEKGHFLVLKAFRELKDKFKNIFLLVCGKGKLENKLKKRIDEMGVKDEVLFVSLKAEDFLDIVDILLVASFKEGFGYTILEAFAKEVCVIGFATGGIKEIIKDKENGLLFYDYKKDALIDTINSLLNDNLLKEKIKQKAKESLEVFSLDKMAHYTEAVYKEVLRG